MRTFYMNGSMFANPRVCFAPADGPMGGNNQQQQQNQQQNQQQQQQNDGNISSVLSADFWQDTPDGNGNNQQQQQQQNQQQNQTQKTPAQLWDDRVASLDFGQLELTPEMQQQIQNGDFSGLSGAVVGMMRNVYKQTMLDAATITNNMKADILRDAQAQNATATAASENVKALEAALPFTKNPAIAPVAQNIMAQAMKKGKNRAEAIEFTKKYFQETTKLSAGDLGLDINSDEPGANGFRGNKTGSGAVPDDWAAYLVG